jgi:hypothetical protein
MVLPKTVTSKLPAVVSPLKIPSWLSTAALAFPTAISAGSLKAILKLHAIIIRINSFFIKRKFVICGNDYSNDCFIQQINFKEKNIMNVL